MRTFLLCGLGLVTLSANAAEEHKPSINHSGNNNGAKNFCLDLGFFLGFDERRPKAIPLLTESQKAFRLAFRLMQRDTGSNESQLARVLVKELDKDRTYALACSKPSKM